MANRQDLLEKESAAFASTGKCRSGVRKKHPGHSAAGSAKLPEIDKLLEDTLVNDIKIVGSLTKRETEILKLIVSSKTNKEIARILCRTQRTIEYHRNRLMRKLNAHNIADLIKRAIAMGIT